MYQIIITANGDYLGGEVKSIHDLVKVFETEDQEEYEEVMEKCIESTWTDLQVAFELAEDEEFDLREHFRKQ
tara:strand:- start:1021 stop:1236 length:216 start_codon:yes stop_codon:yes gene_type:complete